MSSLRPRNYSALYSGVGTKAPQAPLDSDHAECWRVYRCCMEVRVGVCRCCTEVRVGVCRCCTEVRVGVCRCCMEVRVGVCVDAVRKYVLACVDAVWKYVLACIDAVWKYVLACIDAVWKYVLACVDAVWKYVLACIDAVWKYVLVCRCCTEVHVGVLSETEWLTYTVSRASSSRWQHFACSARHSFPQHDLGHTGTQLSLHAACCQ